MADREGLVTLKGNPISLEGEGVKVGTPAPDVTLVSTDMTPKKLSDYLGKTIILSVVPSLDTPVCDKETRRFNEEAASLGDDIVILTVSVDTPMAQKRWCGGAGIDKVQALSDFKDHEFGKKWGLRIKDKGIMCRAVYVIDKEGVVQYEQIVPEVAEEPDYDAVLAAAKQA